MTFLTAFLLFGWLDWKSVKTDNFTVIYKPGYEWEATEVLNNLEYYRSEVTALTGNRPKHLPIVIEDIGTVSNGMADPIFNNIHIYTYPPSGIFASSTENWYRLVSLHEYTHMCHLTKTAGVSRAVTTLFGRIFQPNLFSPGWVVEGITVYSESQLSNYEGRLNDGCFDAYIGARAKEGKLPSIHTATYSPLEFPYRTGIYLYGGEFFNYLADTYGKDRFSQLFDIYGSFFWAPFFGQLFPFFGIDMAARITYGKDLPSLFSAWKRYEEKKYKDWKIDGDRVTKKGDFVKYLVNDGNKLYYVHTYPKKTDALKGFEFYKIVEFNIDTQKEQTLVSLTSPVSTPLRVKNNELYYTTYEFKKGYANASMMGFGIISLLHMNDLKTGKDKVIFSDAIRAFCVLEDGSILYSKDRQHKFGSELWLYRGGKKEQLWVTDYLLGELIANSKYIVTSARTDYKNWDVYLLDLSSKRLTPIATTPWSESNIWLVGDTLLFTANYDKIYSIYGYDILDHKLYQLTQGGYATNGVFSNDNLYFIGDTKAGFDIYKKKIDFVEYTPKKWLVSDRPDFSKNKLSISHGGYFDVLSTALKPAVRIPFILPADTTFKKWSLGCILVGADATYENFYTVSFGYDPIEETPFLSSFLRSLFLSPISIDMEYRSKITAGLGITYPLFMSLSPGLSSLSLYLRGKAFKEDFSRKELKPGLVIEFTFPYTDVFVGVESSVERGKFGSNIERTAYSVEAGIRNYIKGGELRISAKGYSDKENPDPIGIKIRGYDQLYTKTGSSLTLEYAHPILKIRKGLWNPNLFFEDLCAAIFTDVAFAIDGEYNLSCGMELKLETGTMLGLIKAAPKLGIATNKTGNIKFYIGIDAINLGI
ncbi:MAG: hypothetical protein QMD71_05670 [bacterium]|nr:hypothetical protein [bacterium]